MGAAASTRSISIPAHSGLWGTEGDGNRLGLEQRGGKVMWRWDVTPVPSQSSFFLTRIIYRVNSWMPALLMALVVPRASSHR